MALEVWFEFASTYSYPAVMRASGLAAARGIELRWRPFLLGPIFKAQGWQDSPFNLYPAKGRYMWRDLERTCERFGIPYKKPTDFPRSGLLPARIASHCADEVWVTEFIQNVFRANFADDADTRSVQVITTCLQRLNLDAGVIIDAANSEAARVNLRAQTERASDLGIFGAPTFVAGKELFWGHDRMEEAMDWHAAHGVQA